MPHEDRPAPSDEPTRRLQRLGDAMEAFLRFRAGGGGAAEREQFLREQADLRDVLEPLFAAADGEPLDPGAAVLGPGRTLDDYRIVREIGRGGMGTVYEAEQLSLRRRVALKVLHNHLAWSPRSIERFRREAAAAARLRHPGLVPIHEVGEWRGLHWFSMEFVAGTPLNERMREPRLGVRADVGRAAEAAELVARIADALQEAHQQGLVHRDVKPHNVMVCPDGSVRLLDFGLVAGTEGQQEHSATGAFLGTPHYCSPEQIAGRAVGPAADVFALGIVLYELLAGARPFEAETTNAVLRRIEAGQFRRLRQLVPDLPRDLETICHKALEANPRDRYADAGELAADLRRFLRIEPIHATPPTPWDRAGKWLRRHRVGAALGATSLLLAAAAGTAWVLHLRDARTVTHTAGLLDQTDELAFQSIEQTLTLLSDQIDRQPSPGARHEPRADELVTLCESFLAVRTDDPARRMRLARSFWQLAGIYLHLGRVEPALSACARSRTLLLAAAATPRTADVERQLARIEHREMLAHQLADPASGGDAFAAASARWRTLVAAADADPADAVECAALLLARGRNLADQPTQRTVAESLLREARALLARDTVRPHPAAAATAVRVDGTLAQVLLDRHRTQDALALFDAVLAATRDVPTDPVLGVERALAQSGRGEALMRLRRSAEAEQSLRDAVATTAAALADWPGSQALRRRLLASRVLLANMLMVQLRIEDAEDVLRTAAGAIGPLPTTPSQLPWAERALRADLGVQLANCLLMHVDTAASDVADARGLLQEACTLLQTLVTEQPTQLDYRVDLGVAWNSLAALENEHGDANAATAHARRAIEQQEAALAQLPGDVRATRLLGIHHAQLAWALAATGDAAGALAAAAEVPEHAPREVGALRMAAEAATRTLQRPAGDAPGTPDAGSIAVTALRHIATANAAEARRLVADPRFAALRERADFRQLQHEVSRR